MVNEFLNKLNSGALLSAVNENGEINIMTVSWGGAGILWGKQVAFVFVRPQRHTFSFTEKGTKMSLTFFEENDENKKILTFCGTKSGRDIDKIKACGLKYTLDNGYPVFDNAKYTLKLEKIYADTIKKSAFIDTECLKWYKNDDFHTMYICEIIK